MERANGREAEPMKWTVLGRAADPDGAGVEVKWSGVSFDDATRLVSEAPDSLRTAFQNTFGRADPPESVEVFRLPYIEYIDGPEDDV